MDPEYLADAHQDPHTVANAAIRSVRQACEGRPDTWPVFYESDAVTPAVTVGDLRCLLDFVSRADAAEAEAKALREALEIAEETLAMAERPSFEDPLHKDEIEALGNRIGFGALMSSASATWRRLGGNGGEFVCAPCRATVHNALNSIRATLAGEKAEKMDGGK